MQFQLLEQRGAQPKGMEQGIKTLFTFSCRFRTSVIEGRPEYRNALGFPGSLCGEPKLRGRFFAAQMFLDDDLFRFKRLPDHVDS